MTLRYGPSRTNHRELDTNCWIVVEHQATSGEESWTTTYRVRAEKRAFQPYQLGPAGIPLVTTFWVDQSVIPQFGDQMHILSLDSGQPVDVGNNLEILRVDAIVGDYFSYTEIDVRGFIR